MVFVFMLLLLLGSGCATRLPWARTEGLTSAEPTVGRIEKANAKVFDAAWAHLHRNYYDPNFNGQDWVALGREFRPRALAARSERELYGVLDEMLGRLNDGHAYLTTPSMVRLEKSGTSIGLGLETDRIGESWVVTAVEPGSGANLAGVRRGWTVVSVAGREFNERFSTLLTPVDGETVEWVFDDLRGRRRVVPITLRFRKPGDGKVAVPEESDGQMRSEPKPALTAAVMRLDHFLPEAIAPIKKGLDLVTTHKVDRLVIDLRQNAGGDARVMESMAGMFLPKDTALGVFRTRGGDEKKLTTRGRLLYEGKLAILVGGRTGSAAEVFAAVLQEKGRAIVVGRPTAGAVLAVKNYRLPDGGRLSCSRFDYHTPAGKRLERVGVTPDVVVPLKPVDALSLVDKDQRAAEAALNR